MKCAYRQKVDIKYLLYVSFNFHVPLSLMNGYPISCDSVLQDMASIW